MVQLNPVPVFGAKKIPVPFDGNVSPKFPHKCYAFQVLLCGTDVLRGQCARGEMGRREKGSLLISRHPFHRPRDPFRDRFQMIRGRMGSCKRRLGTSQPPQSYNFWAWKLKSYLRLKKCWRTSWVGSSTDEVVISLQEILDQLPGDGGRGGGGDSGFQVTGMIEGFFWLWNFSISGFFGGTPKKYLPKCS